MPQMLCTVSRFVLSCWLLLLSLCFFYVSLASWISVLQPVDTSDYFVDGGFVVPEHPALRDLWFSACMEGTAELSLDKAFFFTSN
jgi:hypothetical protein